MGRILLSEEGVFASTDEQKQARKELADRLMVFVNETFDKKSEETGESEIQVPVSTSETEMNETDLASTSETQEAQVKQETEEMQETVERSGDKNDNLIVYLVVSGLGALLLLIVTAAVIKANRKK